MNQTQVKPVAKPTVAGKLCALESHNGDFFASFYKVNGAVNTYSAQWQPIDAATFIELSEANRHYLDCVDGTTNGVIQFYDLGAMLKDEHEDAERRAEDASNLMYLAGTGRGL